MESLCTYIGKIYGIYPKKEIMFYNYIFFIPYGTSCVYLLSKLTIFQTLYDKYEYMVNIFRYTYKKSVYVMGNE